MMPNGPFRLARYREQRNLVLCMVLLRTTRWLRQIEHPSKKVVVDGPSIPKSLNPVRPDAGRLMQPRPPFVLPVDGLCIISTCIAIFVLS